MTADVADEPCEGVGVDEATLASLHEHEEAASLHTCLVPHNLLRNSEILSASRPGP